MSEPTSDDLSRTGGKDEQQTVLQWPAEKSSDVPLQTGIQAVGNAPRLEVGPVPLTRVGDYELIKEVGRGGMGVVFKARDIRLNRIVALKMIRGGTLANSDEMQRFEKEAAAAGQLQHPNIVALYHVNTYNEQPFLSMEFIGGTSLSERLALGPLSCRRAAEYLESTARAVHYAHTRGIIHRDLKPANVLLDENDQPKVTDFGLAKQMTSRSDQTRTGAILGTPSYMSPEQAAGSKSIGPSSDVYSLGAILYELITGKPPFVGETPLATLNLVAEQDPIPPSVLNPSVDRDLETICLKCLEKSPPRRYDSAESLADDLRRYLHGEAITARRVSIAGRAVKWCKRNKAVSIATSVVLATFSVFLIYSWYETYQEKELRRQADELKNDAMRANEIAGKRMDEMRNLLYLSEMRQAQQSLRRADIEGTMRILDHWLPKTGERDLRDWEWYYLKERCEARLAFGTHVGRAFAVGHRPDGKMIASAGGELNRPGEIKLWDARTGKLLRTITGHGNVVTALSWHPTRALLASASYDHTVKIWDIDSGAVLVTLRGHTDDIYDVGFSRDGSLVASASKDLSVRVWNYETFAKDPAKSVRKLQAHDKAVTSVAFHPEGNQLASGSRDKTIKIWNLQTGQVDKTLTGHEGEVDSLAFNSTGKVLVSGGGSVLTKRGEVHFWNPEEGSLRSSRYGLSDRILHVAISRDGKVAAAGADGMLRIWNQSNSSETLTLRADPQAVSDVAFAPDGFTLVTAGRSGRISLWNSSAGTETLNLSAPGVVETVVFHPTSPFVASAGSRGDIRAWNLDNPERPLLFPGSKRDVFALAFSPDGNQLAAGGDDHVIRVVDFRRPEAEPILLEGHTARVYAVAFHPEGKLLASAGEDELIRIFDVTTGKLDKTLMGHKNGVRCLSFSPDGRWLASGSYDKTIWLWDLKNGISYRLEGHTGTVNAVVFSPIQGKENVLLASASADRTIRVWDVASQKQLYTLEGTPSPVQSLAFHPRGQRLVSIGQDRMIRLWDVATRQEILDFEEHIGNLRHVAFSSDGRSLAGAGLGVVRVWQASKEMTARRK